MAYEQKTGLSPEQRAALKPAFQKIEDGFQELEKSLAALRPRPPSDPDPGGGFCGLDCGCSSFDGPLNAPLKAKCGRDFCKHTKAVHLT